MRKKILISVLSLAIILGIGSTLAYLKADDGSIYNNNITLADFDVELITDISAVSIPAMYPMTDTEGLTITPVTFAIQNNGDITANYKVSLVDKDAISTLLNKDVRYRLKRTVEGSAQETFDIKNLDDTGVIDSGSIAVGVTITYELVMWQDLDSTANGATFSKVILVEGMQSSNLDNSGANFPELLDNMIPVYYEATNDTTGVWKKADSTNVNSTYKWFDYSNQMWANAVTVKETGTHDRDYYLEAEEGTTVEMDDITTMWVWIPRYKYVIFNGNNETAEEQEIKVMFEHGTETTGTVKCHDDISISSNSDHSEVCTDSTNGSIVNHKSTYTHPAFCFGTKKTDGSCDGDELTGVWVAKFEMSTDDTTCNETPNATNCNKTSLNILVKPDVKNLKHESISTIFANIRRMETYGNIHGFSQSEDATTWLDASSNLTGEIANDNNNFDNHMIKNMEWGAVAYLTNSKYGKYGNGTYTAANKEIYVNSNENKTGYSGETNLYNNLTDLEDGTGYSGAKASTTGTVYGVFDMNSINGNGVMATNITSSTNFNILNAGVWTGNNRPIAKYYDIYSNSLDGDKKISKLGDGIKEVAKSTGLWHGDSNSIIKTSSSWLNRGSGENSGIFATNSTTGSASEDLTSRPVLTITRNMPWLNE